MLTLSAYLELLIFISLAVVGWSAFRWVIKRHRTTDAVIDTLIKPPVSRPGYDKFDQTLHDKIKPKRDEQERLQREQARVSATPLDDVANAPRLRRMWA